MYLKLIKKITPKRFSLVLKKTKYYQNYLKFGKFIKPKNLIWIFTERGFGSEILWLLVAILYAEKNNLNFKLCSVHSNITTKNGWTDYFNPFCEEINANFLKNNFYFWQSDITTQRKKQEYSKIANSHLGKSNIYTHDIWFKIYNNNFFNQTFNSTKYNFNNTNGIKALSKIFFKIWQYNPEIDNYIKKSINTFEFKDKEYIVFHIRRGDKIQGASKEVDIVQTSSFVELYTNKLSKYKNIFVITDDYKVYEELVTKLPNNIIKTFCNKDEAGYVNANFSNLDKNIRFNKIKNLLLQIEISKNSNYFVGTYSTNLSKIINIYRENINCTGIDWEFKIIDY